MTDYARFLAQSAGERMAVRNKDCQCDHCKAMLAALKAIEPTLWGPLATIAREAIAKAEGEI